MHKGGHLVELREVKAEVGEFVGFGRFEYHPASCPDTWEGTESRNPLAGAGWQRAGERGHLDDARTPCEDSEARCRDGEANGANRRGRRGVDYQAYTPENQVHLRRRNLRWFVGSKPVSRLLFSCLLWSLVSFVLGS